MGMKSRPVPRDHRRHLLHVFPSFMPGGVPIRIANIINHFGARFRHTIVSLDSRIDCAARIDESLSVAYHFVADGGARLPRRLAEARASLAALAPDLLLTYNWGAIEWALAHRVYRRCPHIHLESGFGPEEADGQKLRRILLRRLALADTARLIVPSRGLVRLARDSWKLPSGKIAYIPNGVNWLRFQAEAAGPKVPLGAARGVVVGTAAPLRAEKNLSRLITAFAGLPSHLSASLLVIGDGPQRAVLEQLATVQGVAERVHFVGHTDSVEGYLAHLDVFAMSSDTEQMPNSLLQAMAASLPVIATDVGDVKWILSEDNAPFVVAKHDSAAFAGGLATLLGDPALRARLAQANRARVRAEFPEERMFRAYGQIFDELLGTARAAA